MNLSIDCLPVKLGYKTRYIYGGPYRKKPAHMRGVKMAAEIKADCDISVPTQDFSVPDPKQLEEGIRKALVMVSKGEPVYVGCMGGVGRTGLFLAVLLKAVGEKQPIKKVRDYYNPHAVETKEQVKFVEDFDVSGLQLTALKAKILSALYAWKK